MYLIGCTENIEGRMIPVQKNIISLQLYFKYINSTFHKIIIISSLFLNSNIKMTIIWQTVTQNTCVDLFLMAYYRIHYLLYLLSDNIVLMSLLIKLACHIIIIDVPSINLLVDCHIFES